MKFEFKITFIYLIIGLVWITFSDSILDFLFSDHDLITKFQTYKGIFYVIVTSVLLFLLLQGHIRNRRKIELQHIEDERHYKALFLDNHAVILLVNPENGQIEEVNNAACEFYGWSHDEFCSMKIYDINTSGVELIDNNMQHVLTVKKSKLEAVHILANGETREVEVFSGPVNLVGRTLLYSYIIDITERKEYEKSIMRLNEELEQKVVERTHELTEANIKLNEINASKDKFFSIIAHDLKNPFNSILVYSQLLLMNFDLFDSEKLKKNIRHILNSAQNAFNLLENLLEWSRSQTGRIAFNPQETNLNFLFITALEATKAIAHNKKISIEIEPVNDLPLFADINMVNTILRNLITNAIKFTHAGGKVMINAYKEQEHVFITVSDNGIGMNQDILERLFKLSGKISIPGTGNEQGTGLGLILCKEFVQKNGGDIFVNSVEGKGSAFTFSLPLLKV